MVCISSDILSLDKRERVGYDSHLELCRTSRLPGNAMLEGHPAALTHSREPGKRDENAAKGPAPRATNSLFRDGVQNRIRKN
jgi:hypothetical protein